MSAERTPPTSEVRAAYSIAKFGVATPEAQATPDLHDAFDAEFDRWLAAHDAEVAARAFDYAVGIVGLDPDYVNHFRDSNPYRVEAARLREEAGR